MYQFLIAFVVLILYLALIMWAVVVANSKYANIKTASFMLEADQAVNPGIALGQPCTVSTQCVGWGIGATDSACCDNVCTKKMRDYLGIGWCPKDCKESIGAAPGSCGKGGQQLGQECTLPTDCAGWGAAATDNTCCAGVCTKKMQDYTGIGYCPQECKAAPNAPAGSCSSTWSWPRKEGEPCHNSTDCAGFSGDNSDVACCANTCAKKIRQWNGLPVCPQDCKGSPNASGNTCDSSWTWPRKEGQPCGTHSDCAGSGLAPDAMACCNNSCTKKVRDFAGIGYCPNECRASFGAAPGSCSSNWHWKRQQGEPCAVDTDCEGNWVFGTVACCKQHCVTKDTTLQTCDLDYCVKHPDKCNAPYPQ